MLRIVQIYLCLSTTWAFVQTEHYKVETNNYMTLDEQGNLDIRESAYLFIKRHNQYTYTAQLEEIHLDTSPHMFLSTECTEGTIVKALRKPFKVFLHGNGKFKSIKVSKNDLDLSIDIKFFLASVLQANKQNLQNLTASGKKFSFDDNTLTHLGKCDVTTKVSTVRGEDKYYLSSIRKPKTCRGFESSAYTNDKQYLDNVCKDNLEQDMYYKFVASDTATMSLKDKSIVKSTAKETLAYRPSKNSDDILRTHYETTFNANPPERKGSSRDPEPFNDDDSKEITELQYINIDKSIMEGPNSNKVIPFYEVVACQPLKNNTYLVILREISKCILKPPKRSG